ncbi:MAG: hypothetical protein ABI906_01630, partial [Pseudomonadota bacterium]
MTAPALLLALALMASAGTPPAGGGEPLPAGAPTGDYELTAWCYGALGEYLEVYDRVKPDLRDIDRMFGSSVKNEAEPYSADMAAARKELKILAGAVEAAEKASPSPIAPKGALAIKLGQSIWRPAEGRTRRELARAWLSWGLPDRCDTTARGLAANSALLGKALNYNNAPSGEAPPVAAEPSPPPSEPAAQNAPPPEAPPPQAPAPEPGVSAPAPAPAPP